MIFAFEIVVIEEHHCFIVGIQELIVLTCYEGISFFINRKMFIMRPSIFCRNFGQFTSVIIFALLGTNIFIAFILLRLVTMIASK